MPADLSILTPSLAGGGAERVMLDLAGGLAARGWRVTLVAAQACGELIGQTPVGVNLVDLKSRRVLAAVPALTAYLRKARPPVLLSAQSHMNLAGIWAAALSRSNCGVLVSEHSTPSSAAREKGGRQRVIPWLIRRFYPRAGGVAAASAGIAADLVDLTGLPPDRIRVIHNPVVSGRLFDLAQAPLEHPWFVPGQQPVILAVGRLSPAKDYPTLLRAFAILKQTRPARLLVLGEGEERPALETLVKKLGLTQEDVLLPGFVPNPYPYMRRAAAFALSSSREGFAVALVEAMALDLPCAATACPGPLEILDGGKYGALVQPGNPAELAAALETILTHSPDPLYARGRALEFTLDRAVDGYETYLENILQCGRVR